MGFLLSKLLPLLLYPLGLELLLVTSAFHMPRSLATFQQRSGLTVVPVACDYQLPDRAHYGQPTLGLAIYRLRGWS